LHQFHHFNQGANRASCAGTARCAESKALDDARDVFAVETARGHHHDATSPPKVSRQENPIVPESVNRNVASAGRVPVFPPFNLETDRSADQVNKDKGNEIHQPDQDLIFEGIRREIRKPVRAFAPG